MSFLMQWEYSWCNTMGKILRSFIIYHLFTLSYLLLFCSQWLDFRSARVLLWKRWIWPTAYAARFLFICCNLFCTQHFSNEISRTFLKGTRKTITLIDKQAQKKYKCRLITTKIASYEKYLGGEWFNFCREHMLEVGDKLIFYLEKPPKNMHVQDILK